jgi:MFS family permease
MDRSSVVEPQGVPLRIVLLLAVAVFINYVDRGNLATAGPLLKDELGLSNSQFGALGSAFFLSYAPLQLLAGWLAQRFDVRYVLIIWASATALVGLVTSFAALLALRLLLGVGESVTYPCNSKLLAQRAPEHQRGRANGVIAGCQALGPTFGTLVGGLIMVSCGWRAAFVGVGFV